MGKKPENANKKWSDADREKLNSLVNGNTPTRIIAMKLKRTAKAIQAKAQEEGISLKPSNQTPYNRKKIG